MKTVFYDTETGGLRMDHPIIEIGAVAIDLANGEIVSEFCATILFKISECDPKALEMNSFSQDPMRWKGASSLSVVLGEFFTWCDLYRAVPKKSKAGKKYKATQVGGYNIHKFDNPRIMKAARHYSLFCPLDLYYGLDVMHLALWHFQRNRTYKPENYKLGTIAKALGVLPDEELHGALVDAKTSALMAHKMLTDA